LSLNNNLLIFTDIFFKKKFIPKDYCFLFNNILDTECEFFLFERKIFGFHFRGNTKLSRNKQNESIHAHMLLLKQLDV